MVDTRDSRQLALLTSKDTPISLDAYLASALTGLSRDERSLVFQISDTVSEICRKHNINLYEPRKQTDPVHHADVQDSEVFKLDRERVLRSDLLIHLGHFPSTGAGEELDFAYNALVPIIILSRTGDRVSRMITGIPSLSIRVEYSEPEEMRARLEECLTQIYPLLQERKVAFSSYERNIVGDRIRFLRESLGLTREELTSVVPALTVDALRQMEESDDRTSNPSLLHLRQIATVLKTTVADLVEPDMTSNVVSHLYEWLEGREAARFSGVSARDRNRILRRILLRVIDSLED